VIFIEQNCGPRIEVGELGALGRQRLVGELACGPGGEMVTADADTIGGNEQWMWTKGTLVAISRLRFELESGDQLHGLLTSTTRVRLSRSCGVSPSRSSSIWCLRFWFCWRWPRGGMRAEYSQASRV